MTPASYLKKKLQDALQEYQKGTQLLQETALAKMAKPKPPQGPPPSKLLKPKLEFLAERQTNRVQIRAVVGQVLDAYGRNEPGQSSQSRFVPKTVAPLQRIGTRPKSKAKPSCRFVPLMPRAQKRMRLRAKAIY
jgi:hypothetical protein